MHYRFGAFDLDSDMYELCCDGEPVAIEPQAFNILLHLVRSSDRIVSRDDLISTVWDGRAISDTALSSQIFALRRALGDTGKAQNVIRTVPRRGFRFVAEVTHVADQPTDAGQDAHKPTRKAADRTPVAAILAGEQADQISENKRATSLPTLVVLPFKIASEGLDEYFCDGLTEDVTSNLTHFRELRVIASSTSFHFKDRSIPVAEIAETLGVDYIVDGSMRREGTRLRVAVQLIESTSGMSLWADRYDRQLEDIFAVQDAITHMIVAALGVKIQNTALSLALRKSPSELDAYDHLLRARRYTATLNEEMHAEARTLLEQAIALDPNYADAYALLANVYLAEHRFEANPRPNPIERALSMALKATELDPQSAYAHCWLAIVHFFRKDIGKFEVEMQRAVDLNPNDPEILAEAGHYLTFVGEFERGRGFSNRAQKLNPLHPGWYHFSPALRHYHQRKYEEVLVDVQRISMPDFYWAHILKAATLGQLGRDEAVASLAMLKSVKRGVSAEYEMRKWNVPAADFAHLMEGLRKAGYTER
jgi:TolB-like protein